METSLRSTAACSPNGECVVEVNQIISALIEKLFEPEKRRLAATINDLNASNKRLKKLQFDGFLYGGKVYRPSGVSTVVMSAGQANAGLDFSLNHVMESWLRDQKIILDDQAFIKQMLFRLLKPCQSGHQVRNALPECLVGLAGLGDSTRTDPMGFTLEGDERALRQFAKLLEKMELYAVTRLLY